MNIPWYQQVYFIVLDVMILFSVNTIVTLKVYRGRVFFLVPRPKFLWDF